MDNMSDPTGQSAQILAILNALRSSQQGDAAQQIQMKRDVWGSLGPEGQRKQVAAGQIEQQLAQAEALRKPKEVRYSSPKAALWQGLGNIAGNIGGGIRQHQLEGQQVDARLGYRNAEDAAHAKFLQAMQPQTPPLPQQTAEVGIPEYLRQMDPNRPYFDPKAGLNLGDDGAESEFQDPDVAQEFAELKKRRGY